MAADPAREKLEIADPLGDGTLAVTSYSSKHTTIESVIKQCKVDLSQYEIASPKIRKWDVPIKQKNADGETHLDIVECYYIGFSLVPKTSIRIISPIVSKVKYAIPVRKSTRIPAQKLNSISGERVVGETTVVLSDPQIGYRKNQNSNRLDPFHDRAAMDVALQITRHIDPDTVVINGDWLDMSEWSDKFSREPGFFFTTQPALFETHFWLQKIRKSLPNARIVYIEGNHEVRLRNAIINHLLSLATIVDVKGQTIGSLASLLGLDSLGIEYLCGYPNSYLDLGPIVVVHGHIVRGKSPDTANAILQRIDKSHLIGHVHRPEFAVKTVSMSGVDKEIFAMTSGCLCRTDFVVPGHQRGSVWQQGIVVLQPSGDLVTPYQIPIKNGKAIFGRQGLGFDRALKLGKRKTAQFKCAMRLEKI